MSKVDDATTADGASSTWFKIDEFGYQADNNNKTWGTDALNNNCGKRTFTIPGKIPGGDYLVRAEAIALHAAGGVGGAQFYMSCFVSYPFSGSFVMVAVADMIVLSRYSKSRLLRARRQVRFRLGSRSLVLIVPRTRVSRLIFMGAASRLIRFRGLMLLIRVSSEYWGGTFVGLMCI